VTTVSLLPRILGILSGVLTIPFLALLVWSRVTSGFFGEGALWIAVSVLSLLFLVTVTALAFLGAFSRRKEIQLIILWVGFLAGILEITSTVMQGFARNQWYNQLFSGLNEKPIPFNVGSVLKNTLGFYVYQPSSDLSAEVNFLEGLFPMAAIGFDVATMGLLAAAMVATVSRNSSRLSAAIPQVWSSEIAGMTADAVPSRAPQSRGTGPVVGAVPTALVITPEIRRGFLVEAIRREPSFATAQDTETLRRLGEMMRNMEQEYRRQIELTQLQDAQIAAVDRAMPPLGPTSEPAPASSNSLAGETADWDGIRT